MKFKIDENLPSDCAIVLRNAGFEADTVTDEHLGGADDPEIFRHSQEENRVLVALDLGFGNVRAYPPAEHAGIIVLRTKQQDKHSVLALMHRVAVILTGRAPAGEPWIVEPDRIRFR